MKFNKSFETIPLELQTARRGPEDWQNDGDLCPEILSVEPGHLHQPRHLLRAQLCHHHAQHQPPQPQRQGQAQRGAVYHYEQGHQWWRESSQGAAGIAVWKVNLSRDDICEFKYLCLFSIKTEPFKIPEDDGNDLMHTFFNPDKEGWLWKQGGRYKSWKRRWFILNDNCLYYFEFTTDKEPRGIIPLENIKVTPGPSSIVSLNVIL